MRRFITAFTRARNLSLSWASSIQSMPVSHFLKIHLTIILPSYAWVFKMVSFPQVTPTNFDKAPRFFENLSTRGMCTCRHVICCSTKHHVTWRGLKIWAYYTSSWHCSTVVSMTGCSPAGRYPTEHGGSMFLRNTGTNAEYTVLWFTEPEMMTY